MTTLFNITTTLLLEQDSKLTVLRKSISERIPISIYYKGPSDEVLEGERYDIEPIVLGTKKDSGNLVIWAYVFKGVSKKGLPGWKMFRVDRIQSVKFNLGTDPFKLTDLPGYQRGKAPSAMKSLSNVEIFSPYWFEDDMRFKKNVPTQPPPPQPTQPTPVAQPTPGEQPPVQPAPPVQPTPQQEPEYKPEMDQASYGAEAVDFLNSKLKDVNGVKTITPQEYDIVIKDLYTKKESEWKNYQRMLGNNQRPGEGTRTRFTNQSKQEIDDLLSNNSIQVTNNTSEFLSEMIKKFKHLIKS
jgi:hypothetical protein